MLAAVYAACLRSMLLTPQKVCSPLIAVKKASIQRASAVFPVFDYLVAANLVSFFSVLFVLVMVL